MDDLSNLRDEEPSSSELAGVVESYNVREQEETDTPTFTRRGRKAKAKRVPLAIVDGKLDMSRVSDEQMQQLSAAIAATPEAQEKLKTVQQQSAEIPLSLCMGLYDAVAGIERLIAIHIAHYPVLVAVHAFNFTPEQKQVLAVPTKKVLEKYIPASWMEYSPEAELIFTLAGIVQMQITTANKLVEQMQQMGGETAHGPNGKQVTTTTQ